jgi:hypothetical protein
MILSEDDDMVKGDTEVQLWGGELTKPYPDGIELKVLGRIILILMRRLCRSWDLQRNIMAQCFEFFAPSVVVKYVEI